mgnify:CR=1 FL=1
MNSGNGKINAGEIHIVLDGEPITLRPTMRAADLISNQLGGFAKARQAIYDENRNLIVSIIRIGSGMKEEAARKLPEMLWRNGLNLKILMPLLEYLSVLNNGGRPLPADQKAVFRIIEGDSNEIDEDNMIKLEHQFADEDQSSEKNDLH